MCPSTALPFFGRNYAAIRTAEPYSLSASTVIVGSATAAPLAAWRSGVSNGGWPIAVTSKVSQAEKPTAVASGAIAPGW